MPGWKWEASLGCYCWSAVPSCNHHMVFRAVIHFLNRTGTFHICRLSSGTSVLAWVNDKILVSHIGQVKISVWESCFTYYLTGGNWTSGATCHFQKQGCLQILQPLMLEFSGQIVWARDTTKYCVKEKALSPNFLDPEESNSTILTELSTADIHYILLKIRIKQNTTRYTKVLSDQI